MANKRDVLNTMREAMARHGIVEPNERPVLVEEVGKDGLFAVPTENFTAEKEVEWAKRRQDSIRVAQYADSKCGLPNVFDPQGAYLCGGCADGSSSPCNKFITETRECLIRIKLIDEPNRQSCGFWETRNAGDPEARYCPKGKLDDPRISFGETDNPKGFGCERCEYGQQTLPMPDSEGRTRWCALKGHPVEDKSCCADNEAEKAEEKE
jgi:hypothetical protein